MSSFTEVDRARFLPPVMWVDDPVAGVVRVNRYVEAERWYRYADAGDGGPGVVRQWGGRSLWGEVEEALGWWESEGRSSADCFGLTAGVDGSQTVWLDEPHRTVPPVP